MPEVSGHLDRRRQPQVALQAVKHALAEIDWQRLAVVLGDTSQFGKMAI